MSPFPPTSVPLPATQANRNWNPETYSKVLSKNDSFWLETYLPTSSLINYEP